MVIHLLKRTAVEWVEDKAPQLGAALAYYTVFSLAPLILVLLAIVGVLFRNDPAGAWSKITEQMGYFLDRSAVQVIQDIAQKASEPAKSVVATIIGFVLAIFGASGVFGQLQDALNTIWGLKAKPGAGIWSFLRARVLSFAMVGGICFLLLVSLVIEGVLKGLSQYLQGSVPGGATAALCIYLIFDLVVVLLLFAMIFKYLPDAKIHWRDVSDWRRAYRISFPGGEMGARPLSRQRRGRLGLRCGQLAHYTAALDLLLLADPPLRRRVHAGLCGRIWFTATPNEYASPDRTKRDRVPADREVSVRIVVSWFGHSIGHGFVNTNNDELRPRRFNQARPPAVSVYHSGSQRVGHNSLPLSPLSAQTYPHSKSS